MPEVPRAGHHGPNDEHNSPLGTEIVSPAPNPPTGPADIWSSSSARADLQSVREQLTALSSIPPRFPVYWGPAPSSCQPTIASLPLEAFLEQIVAHAFALG